MKFQLINDLFDLLIDIPDINNYISNNSKNDLYTTFEIKRADFREVQLLINDEIVLNGMDNQDTVNKLGIKLYKLYDELVYQKNKL